MFIINAYRYLVTLIHTTFDGMNEYITLGSDSSITIQRTDTVSISAWVYRDVAGINHYIYGGRRSGDIYNTNALSIRSTNKVSFWLRSSNVTPLHQLRVNTTTSISTGVWTHILVTYDGTSTPSGTKIYINGISDTLTTEFDTLTTDLNVTSMEMNIGTLMPTEGWFDGKIDKVIFYNTELTAGNVTTIYNYGRKPGLIGIGGEVSQWEMDTLNPVDVVGSNNGTSVNQDSSNIVNG